MKIFYRRSIRFFFAIGIVGLFLAPSFVLAQTTDFGIADVDQNLVLSGQDITVTIVRIISAVLGLLGIIAIGIVLYGGFVYMTSGGDEEKIGTAKKILTNGAIGLVIILSSWTITRFVIKALSDATGSGSVSDVVSGTCQSPAYAASHPNQCGAGGIWYPGQCADSISDFVAKSLTPITQKTGMNNTAVRVLFNHPLESGIGLDKVFTVSSGGSAKNTLFQFEPLLNSVDNTIVGVEARLKSGNTLCFDGTTPCLPNGIYTVAVNEDIKDLNGTKITTQTSCGSFPLQALFTVKNDGLSKSSAIPSNVLSVSFDQSGLSPGSVVPLEKGVFTGTVVGNSNGDSAVKSIAGVFGNGIVLDGVDDAVTFSGSPTFHPQIQDFSFSLWMKPDTFTAAQVLASGGLTNSAGWVLLARQNGASKELIFQIRKDQQWIAAVAPVAGELFTHVSGIYDAESHAGVLFVNGSPFSTFSPGQFFTPPTGNTFDIGRRVTGGVPSAFFDGIIDEVAIFDKEVEPSLLLPQFITKSNTALPADLFLHWKLDETTMTDGTSLSDASGNGHAGVVHAATQNNSATTGIATGAFALSGSAENYFEGLNTTIKTSAPLTLGMWIKPEQVTGEQAIFSYGGQGDSIGIKIENGKLVLSDDINKNNAKTAVAGAAFVLKKGEWYHLALTIEQNGMKRLFLNGTLVAFGTGPAISLVDTDLVRFGKSAEGLFPFFGAVDDVRAYDRLLTDLEIAGLHAATRYGSAEKNVAVADTTSPTMTVSVAPTGLAQMISASASDESGIGYVRLEVTDDKNKKIFDYYHGPTASDGSDAPVNDPFLFSYPLTVPAGASSTASYTLKLTAFDIDHQSISVVKPITIAPQSCFDGAVGGVCGGGGGTPCANNSQCALGFQCLSNQCTAVPTITEAAPLAAGAGSFVTIQGKHFGTTKGQVAFWHDVNGNAKEDANELIFSSLAQCGGKSVWSDSAVIIEVPGNTLPLNSLSAIKLIRTDGKFDLSTDGVGPVPGGTGLFKKTETVLPALCSVTVVPTTLVEITGAGGAKTIQDIGGNTAAPPGTPLIASGKNFGSATGAVLYGGIQGPVSFWTATDIQTSIPGTMNPGVVPVTVSVAGLQSNPVPFTILSSDLAEQIPIIASISPQKPTPKSFVTIAGTGFGFLGDKSRVVLANTFDTAKTCLQNNTPHGLQGCWYLTLSLPQCDSGIIWSQTQIIAAITEDIPPGDFVAVLRNHTGLISDGSDLLSVVSGAPLPSICHIAPASGPAPLPDPETGGVSTLAISGANFSTSSVVYYWTKGSAASDLSTWLSSAKDTIKGKLPVIGATDTQITTRLPLNASGYSMQTGPIVIAGGGKVSNPILYTVEDCRSASPSAGEDMKESGYHCCSAEGTDVGQWLPNAFSCQGEVRDGGYVWRFTTGNIPKMPHVVEECSQEKWFDSTVAKSLPSPAPWEVWTSGTNVCLNATIVVRFGPAGIAMDRKTVNKNTVHVYTCGSGAKPSCNYETELSSLDLATYNGSDVLTLLKGGAKTNLLPNTWHRVTLGKAILSKLSAEGIGSAKQLPLLASRPLDDKKDVAYSFDFKTGAVGTLCTLIDAEIDPLTRTVYTLGEVPDPYDIWGVGSQECSVFPVDTFAWQWNTDNAEKATIVPTLESSASAVATALANAPEGVILSATTMEKTTTTATLNPQSTLIISLGDPEVVGFTPNCLESCTNALISATFNRQMATSTYLDGLRFFKCSDATCTTLDLVPVISSDLSASTMTMLSLSGIPLEVATYYKVSLNGKNTDVEGTVHDLTGETNGIRSLEQITPPILGKKLKMFEWTFRTQDNGTPCAPNAVHVAPDPFVAHEIGETTVYTAIPYSSPDSCSSEGQALDPLVFGFSWTTGNQSIAAVSSFNPQFGYRSDICSDTCLPVGADIASSTKPLAWPVCGNSNVDVGEDCDRAKEASCGLDCLYPKDSPNYLAGSPSVANFDATKIGASWCGDKKVTQGEACDVGLSEKEAVEKGLTPNDSFLGCTLDCRHKGTPASAAWCATQPRPIKESLACLKAISVCNNGKLEENEECEFVSGNPGKLQIWSFGSGEGSITGSSNTVLVPSTAAVCSPICLLKDIANIVGNNPIPLKTAVNWQGYRCDPKTFGCTKDGTLAGSNAGYPSPSVCGDGVVGSGEFPMCELFHIPTQTGTKGLGAAGTQIVTAIGTAPADTATGQLETTITAKAEKQINPETQKIESIGGTISAGIGQYAIQCGYHEFETPKSIAISGGTSPIFNDCPNNTTEQPNLYGVGESSCCQPRPYRTSEYPLDGAGILPGSEPACRNTLISVAFSSAIKAETFTNENAIILRGDGHDACKAEEVDVTTEVSEVITLAYGISGEKDISSSFFGRLWQRITGFLARVIGQETFAIDSAFKNASALKMVKHWCKTSVSLTPEADDGDVTLLLDEALLPNELYAVLLIGSGEKGIRSEQGVGIRAADGKGLDDVFVFKTGADICTIESVEVNPPSFLFTKPSQSASFTATAAAKNNALIVPTPSYNWDWSWAPLVHPIFAIPALGGPAETATIEIAAKNLQGTAVAAAKATVTNDATGKAALGTVFAGTSKLSAFFCERPWPAVQNSLWEPWIEPTYNISFSYCADAGQSGMTDDDLPYLSVVDLGGIATTTEFLSGVLPSEVLQRYLFVNDKNQDAVGLQIIKNPERLSAALWFAKRFPDIAGAKNIVVDGFDGIEHGKNIYINAPNVIEDQNGEVKTVFHNIYEFSRNAKAAAGTEEAFSKILDSLHFVVNLSDVGLCLSAEAPTYTGLGSYTVNELGNVSSISCASDFDCHAQTGAVKDGTNGVCSIERTAFFRDWQRVGHVSLAQTALDQYFAEAVSNPAGFKGNLAAGSFIPGYTNSKWGSWGLLGTVAKAPLPPDPLNQWVGCAADPLTCYDAQKTQFFCPALSSVYEYSYQPATMSYTLHVPLEYFSNAEVAVGVFGEMIPNPNALTDEPSCDPGVIISPKSGLCGDGIVGIGEQCDPPGVATLQNFGFTGISNTSGVCSYSPLTTGQASCFSSADCGWKTLVYTELPINEADGHAEDDSRADTSGHSDTTESDHGGQGKTALLSTSGQYVCTKDGKVLVDAVLSNQTGGTELWGFACSPKAVNHCRKTSTYTLQAPQTSGTYPQGAIKFLQDSKVVSLSNATSFLSVDTECLDLQKIKEYAGPAVAGICKGAAQTVTTGQCLSGTKAWSQCTSSCQVSYGTCEKIGSCGNGVKDPGEVCDDGTLNGKYAQCNAGCTGYSADFCGDGNVTQGKEVCDWKATGFGLYAFEKNKSCNVSCTGSGGYCGDGVLDPSEVCDDGNTVETDSCTTSCTLGAAYACVAEVDALGSKIQEGSATKLQIPFTTFGAQTDKNPSCMGLTPNAICGSLGSSCTSIVFAPAFPQTVQLSCGKAYSQTNNVGVIITCGTPTATGAPVCGNGAVENQTTHPNADPAGFEACDLGNKNGIACTPSYGGSCTYCSNDCKAVLTVDPISFCGNGVIDTSAGEICEGTGEFWQYPDKFQGAMIAKSQNYTVQNEGRKLCVNQCKKIEGKTEIKNLESPLQNCQPTNTNPQATNIALQWINLVDPSGETLKATASGQMSVLYNNLPIHYALSAFKPPSNSLNEKYASVFLNTHSFCTEDHALYTSSQSLPDYYQFQMSWNDGSGILSKAPAVDIDPHHLALTNQSATYDLITSPVIDPAFQHHDLIRSSLFWRSNDFKEEVSFFGRLVSLGESGGAPVTVDRFTPNNNTNGANKTGFCTSPAQLPPVTASCIRNALEDPVYMHTISSATDAQDRIAFETMTIQYCNSAYQSCVDNGAVKMFAYTVKVLPTAGSAPIVQYQNTPVEVSLFVPTKGTKAQAVGADEHEFELYAFMPPTEHFSIQQAVGSSSNQVAKIWWPYTLVVLEDGKIFMRREDKIVTDESDFVQKSSMPLSGDIVNDPSWKLLFTP